jgi:hypothetical protein
MRGLDELITMKYRLEGRGEEQEMSSKKMR